MKLILALRLTRPTRILDMSSRFGIEAQIFFQVMVPTVRQLAPLLTPSDGYRSAMRSSCLFGSVAKLFYSVMRAFYFGVLTENDVTQRRRKRLIDRLLEFFHRRIFTALTFCKNSAFIFTANGRL